MKLTTKISILFFLFCNSTFANDRFNSYVWNSKNIKAKNGQTDRGDWYEWWYYKVVDAKTREAFFFTYGVINPWDTFHRLKGTKAVVQAGNFKQKIMVTSEFPIHKFSASYESTEVKIAENLATDKRLVGHINEAGHDIAWDLTLDHKWRFNAMGWATGVSGISNIYWYPAQASATMNGWIRYDGIVHQLINAPAYQDRNWGRSFPKWWTWLTSNSFAGHPDTTFAAGGGEPKALNSVYLFAGLCVGLKHKGKEYIFRSTDGDYVNFDIRWGVWDLVAENSEGQRIELSAYAPPDQFMMLPFHAPRGSTFYDYEALLGKMTIKLFERSNRQSAWRPVAELVTNEAGIEWGTPEPLESTGPHNFLDLFRSPRL